MYNYCFLFLVSILLIACSNTNKEHTDNFSFPTIIDTVDYHIGDTCEHLAMTTTNYQILYIGPAHDSLSIGYYLSSWRFLPPPPPIDLDEIVIDEIEEDTIEDFSLTKYYDTPFDNYITSWGEGSTYKYSDSTKILLQIDTSQETKSFFSDCAVTSKAYPVLLTNKDKDTITVMTGDHLPMILEALDSTNQWRAIEKRHRYKCGVGLSSTFLPPNEVIVTSCIIYKGPYKTSLRLKFGINYSNTFIGSIHYSQFKGY